MNRIAGVGLWLLVGCGAVAESPGVAPEAGVSASERVLRVLALQGPSAPRRGVPERYVVIGARAGAVVQLWASPNVNGPGISFAGQGLVLDVAAPTSHRVSAVADRQGRAEFDLTFHGNVGKQYELQAMVVNLPNNTHLLSRRSPIVQVAPPPAGCTLAYQRSNGAAADVTKTGTCELFSDGALVGMILFRDAPLDLTNFDLESSAAWTSFQVGGGSALGIFSLGTASFSQGSTGTLQDFSGLSASAFGTSEFKDLSTFQFDALDTAASTFTWSVAVNMQQFTSLYPPPADPNQPGQVSFGGDLVPGAETGTLTITGGYTLLAPPP